MRICQYGYLSPEKGSGHQTQGAKIRHEGLDTHPVVETSISLQSRLAIYRTGVMIGADSPIIP